MVEGKQELPLLPGEQLQQSLEEDDYMDEIYAQYPDFDDFELNKQIEIVMKAQAEEYNLTEEEYLERIGSDAKSIEELTNPSDEMIAKAMADLQGKEKRSYQKPLIIALVVILTIALLGGAIYLFGFSKKYGE
ncbi:MAG: hypothetical protein ABIA37_04255 [Candidatus Woesearchaeota archaeon]